MSGIVFTRTFPSEVCRVKSIEKELMDFLRTNISGITTQDDFELRLVFNELLFNAVVHGNKQDYTKCVMLRVEIMPENAIHAVVSDEGLGFDYMRLISAAGKDADIFNENGRGIKLVHSLTDNLSFNMTGNQIKFYKRVAVSHG